MINQEIIDKSKQVIKASLATETGQLLEPIPLLKFRPLDSAENFERLMKIIETGKLWCSKVSELNDPMEGVFMVNLSHKPPKDPFEASGVILKGLKIDEAVRSRVICSLSAIETVNNLLVWSHYAGGFRGVALEVFVKYSQNLYPILYKTDPSISTWEDSDVAPIDAIRRKHKLWDYEAEVRFISKGESKEGALLEVEITGVYVSFLQSMNHLRQINDSPTWKTYYWRLWHVVQGLKQRGIDVYAVDIPNAIDIKYERWGDSHDSHLALHADKIISPGSNR